MKKLLLGLWRALLILATNGVLASAAQVGNPATLAPKEPSATVEMPSSSEIDLQLLTRRAALIFSGTVTEIDMHEREPRTTEHPDTGVAIKFQVDEGIKGVATGEQLTIREWRGLWNGGRGQRYRVGEHVLIFYHQPSPLGFSSPVSGDAGRFAIKASDKLQLTLPQRRALLRASRLHTNLTDAQISSGLVKYEQVAKIIRQMVAEQ
jgi:hypothetical protein